MITLPETVRAKARLAGADAWLTSLPSLVAALCKRWSLILGRTFPDATEAFVAEATRADGTPAVLKLMIPRLGNHARHEITVLRLADGEGCVRLLEAEEDLGAMLVERLGPALSELNRPIGERLAILADAARKIWRPIPAGVLPTALDKARWLADFITTRWSELDHPCARRTIDHALGALHNRSDGYAPERAVLVHGDVHQWNALRSPAGFKLVDPDGLHAEPEYDLGVLMREDPVELMAGDPWSRAHWLAARTGTDPTAIWEWGVAERVSTGLVLTGINLQPVATQMLAAADELSR